MFNELYYYMRIRNVNKQQMAEAIGCTRPTFSRKLKKKEEFTVFELKRIKEALNIDNNELIKIFFK